MVFSYRTIKEVGRIRGKRILLRLDLNVPIVNGGVRDGFRIRQILPTLAYLKEAGAKVIILAHIESVETDSLEVVAKHLNTLTAVGFVRSFAELAVKIEEMGEREIVVLENLRALGAGEKENSEEFAQKLASFGDLYVNEAFSVSHREHASIVGLPKFLPSCAGLLFDSEIRHLSEAFAPARPFLFVLGGAKFATKMPLIQKFLEKADTVFVGGALSNDLFRERGWEIGRSVTSEKRLDLRLISENPKLAIPLDVVVNVPGSTAKLSTAVSANDRILDSGPKTQEWFVEQLKLVKFVLWNGPLGDYEKGFEQGTIDLAQAIAQVVAESGVRAILGGGDTVAMLDKVGLLDKYSFVSTGGGAMLDFLANETLPGIKALIESQRKN